VEPVLRAVAELSDRMTHGGSMAPEQARRLQAMLVGLATLLAEQTGPPASGTDRYLADGYLREA